MSQDISEDKITEDFPGVLEILLKDRTTKKNIIWGTDNYLRHGREYQKNNQIFPGLITNRQGKLIKPRINKSQAEQKKRSKDMAEVFTPAWICNKQNNTIDELWFGRTNVFNKEEKNSWCPTDKVVFDEKHNWKSYVEDLRLEITCGEAPYLVSRYDATSGEMIPVLNRVGLLDRKLRVINENVNNETEWRKWTKKALQSVYGFDFQGDNVLLARENLFISVFEFYKSKFDKDLSLDFALEISEIISWNIFQMDGLKYVIPYSCHMEEGTGQMTFDFESGELVEPKATYCEGCVTGNNALHNGIYVLVKDWKTKKNIRFLDIVQGR